MLQQPQRLLDSTAFQYERLQTCNCCPYGYHIDLDFLSYVESLIANIQPASPSDGELLRRDKRRSRLSKEFMLGLDINWEISDEVYPVQEVQFECEPDSPSSVTKKVDYIGNFININYVDDSPHHSLASSTNSPLETKSFVHECLDDVVSDFERTLERTKKKENKSENIVNGSWDYFEHEKYEEGFKFESPSISKHSRSVKYATYQCPKKKEKSEEETIKRNLLERYEVIQKRMELTLFRVQELEEELKQVDYLKEKVGELEKNKEQLEKKLQEENEKVRKLEIIPPPPPIRSSSTNINIQNKLSFTPQRISPISLESLGARMKTSSQSSNEVVSKRDIGVMFKQQQRDAGISTHSTMVRSIGTNPSNTTSVHDMLYDKKTVNEMISASLDRFTLQREKEYLSKQISVGTQMAVKEKNQKTSQTQTLPERRIQYSKGITACPNTRDFSILVRPDVRSIGSSENKITDILCEKCMILKKTVACGPDDKKVSPKLPQPLIRSNTFSIGENESLNLKRKPASTQCEISVSEKSTQSIINRKTISTQSTPDSVSTYTQYIPDNKTKLTDTKGLLKLVNTETNTDAILDLRQNNSTSVSHTASNTDFLRRRDNGMNTDFPKTKESGMSTEQRKTYEYGTNTDIFKTREYGTNTQPKAVIKHSASNTEEVYKRDIGCGEIVKPHISIACADNYCDSCKDAIKNLAKNFSKTLSGSASSLTGEQSKIPRPTGLPSPSASRKKFTRQNTYTIDDSPVENKQNEVVSGIIKSLDTEKSEQKPQNLHLNRDIVSIRKETKYKTLIKGRDEIKKKPDETSLSLPTTSDAKDESKDIQCKKTTIEVMDKINLNRIATATLEPREKNSPTKEMKAALKVINDSLKSASKSQNLKSANAIVQKEWFKISSTDKANPLDVEDYLDYFEEISNSILKYMVNLSDANGNTAMHYAISHGNFDVVSILLDSKVCDVNQTNNAGYTCVMLVSLAKLKNSAHRTVVQRLFQMADVNIRAKKHSQTALMLAVSHGNLDMAEMLLAAGADINIQDEDGSSSLLCAAEHGRIDIVKLLLSQPDCDSTIQDVDGSTAFKIAWQAGHRDIGLLLYVHEQMLRSKKPEKSPLLKHQKSSHPPSTPPAPTA